MQGASSRPCAVAHKAKNCAGARVYISSEFQLASYNRALETVRIYSNMYSLCLALMLAGLPALALAQQDCAALGFGDILPSSGETEIERRRSLKDSLLIQRTCTNVASRLNLLHYMLVCR